VLQKVFDDEYYSRDVDKQKPVFTDDEDDGLSMLVIFHPYSQCCISSFSLFSARNISYYV